MATIAIIEDEPILRQLMSEELERSHHQVLVASDGEAGWELIQTKQPDLILLDLLMPFVSGYQVLTLLRQDEKIKGIPCIVISNSGQADDLDRAYACGADDVLIKADFNPHQLVGKVEELLAKKKALLNK